MQHKVFTIYDTKAEAYLQPFFMQGKGQALRAFTDLVNDQNHQFGKHPSDYVLFELGTFEDTTATFDNLNAPISLGVGIEFIKA